MWAIDGQTTGRGCFGRVLWGWGNTLVALRTLWWKVMFSKLLCSMESLVFALK